MFPLTYFSDFEILGLVLLLLLTLSLFVWRRLSDQPFSADKQSWPLSRDTNFTKESQVLGKKPRRDSAPSYSDLVQGELTKSNYSSQLQTDTYNLRVERAGDQMRYVVNGVAYTSLNEIPERQMRKMAKKLYDKTFRVGIFGQSGQETIRQVKIGNQSAIEHRSPDHSISIQIDGKQKRYIVNGLTYYNLKEITDLDMLRKARNLEKKMF